MINNKCIFFDRDGTLIKAPVDKKKLPKSFISKDGFNVTSKAIKYLQPLIIGEAFPKFKNGIPVKTNLKLVQVTKKLKNWRAN